MDYLRKKIDKTNLNNPKANSGVRSLAEVEKPLEELVQNSFEMLQLSFTKVASDNPAGECRLTAVSSLIGTHTVVPDEELGLYDTWVKVVRVGDLFIEAYYNCGLVDLYYPQMRDSHHIVLATKRWTDIEPIDTTFLKYSLRSSIPTIPPNISGPMQMHVEEEKPVIKGNKKPFNLDNNWVRAADKLQQTGWRVNKKIFAAMQANEKDFISFKEIKDNDAKEQKRRSKNIEWRYTIAKASQLVDYEIFYQSIETDYRGRIYYSEPFFNFQGSDLARGMMQFARGKPMISMVSSGWQCIQPAAITKAII